ncbi:dihydrolipoamide acetyltransferase family protein [Streptomyces sp. NBC_01716]|uniref:dihydrolipoamide acetyltransferase family protein n=1 Tax=Streptomyces sp. NBC_01716 TaxID=2975917 RepID=UPI002E33936E|nr:dihydrolipoamide acetyltransferase family protein [Streptomyces sp. NBC_01716]
MADLLRMPEVAAGSTAAVLSGWPVAEGASFSAGDSLVVVETDKAEVDVPATSDGSLLKTLVPAGTEVEVGSPIAVITMPGEEVRDLETLFVSLGIAQPAEFTEAVRRDVPDPASTPPTSEPPTSEPPMSAMPARVPHQTQGRIFASPLARRLAREAGIAIESITGTGPGGRIVRDDITRAVAATPDPAPAAPRTSETVPLPAQRTPAPEAVPPYETIPHSRIRRAIATRLTESKQNAPHFYLKGQIRVGELLSLRRQLNAAGDVKISVNDLLIKAVAKAHVQVPEMNVIWTDDAVHRFDAVDISVAIATESGLVTPVLRNVGGLSLSAISTQVRAFGEQARGGTLRQRDLEGGSITISNLGMYGAEEFSAIINPPQAAILAVGTTTRAPVVADDGSLQAADLMTLTLSVDHRPADGTLAARWFSALREHIETPLRLLT